MVTLVLVMVSVPLLPEATLIGLVYGPAEPPLSVALAVLLLVSPRVMVPPLPKAAVAVPTTVPELMFTPPVKVLAWDKVAVPL